MNRWGRGREVTFLFSHVGKNKNSLKALLPTLYPTLLQERKFNLKWVYTYTHIHTYKGCLVFHGFMWFLELCRCFCFNISTYEFLLAFCTEGFEMSAMCCPESDTVTWLAILTILKQCEILKALF